MKSAASFFAVALGLNGLFCAWLAALFFGQSPVLQVFISTQGALWLWRSELFWNMRPFIAGVAVLLAGGASVLGRQALQRGTAQWPKIFLPLVPAPLLALVSLYRDCLPPSLAANLIFYFSILLLSLSLTVWLSMPSAFGRLARIRLNPIWAIGIGAGIFFFVTGLYYTQSCGAHTGDEGHYLIVADSLCKDRDLDIKNNLIDEMGAENVRRLGQEYLHVSPFSCPPHWFSYHAPGLSFLLAPVMPGGAAARHGALGIIAGAACAVMWLLCRRSGASPIACGTVLGAFCFSIYWCVYASRALPEALGACLVAWLCWSALVQKEYPWRSALLAGFGCAYLPWVQIRFYPLALAGLVIYFVGSLRTPEAPARRYWRLSIFFVIGAGGIVLYRFIQNRMFVGGFSHQVNKLLLAYPPGVWCVLTNPDGLLNIFPMALWMAAAGLLWLILARRHRRMAVILSVIFGFSWLCVCATPNYGGGAALGGRFLLVVMPLLLPATAAIWDRAVPAARWWLVFLATISVALCGLELICLPELGRAFDRPFCDLPAVIPLLRGLQYPFCGAAHVLVLFLLTVILLRLRSARPAIAVAAILLAGSVIWHAAGSLRALTSFSSEQPDDPARVAHCLARMNLERIHVSSSLAGRGPALFDVSDSLRREGPSDPAPSVTTRDLGVRMQAQLVSQPRLEINDWRGRPYRWTTLAAPFEPGRGQRAFSLEGRLEGTATAIVAVREGASTILEQPLGTDAQGIVRFKIAVWTAGRHGHMYLLLRLEGDGAFRTERLHWSPVSRRLLDQAGLAW